METEITDKQHTPVGGSDAPTCCAFEVGDRVTVAGDFKKGEQGYIKELLTPKDDCGTEDDLWVVVLRECDSWTEEHFYSRNIRLGWKAKSCDQGYAGCGVAHHKHNVQAMASADEKTPPKETTL